MRANLAKVDEHVPMSNPRLFEASVQVVASPAPHPNPLSHGTTFGSPGGERERRIGT